MSNEATKAKINQILNSEEKLAQWASWNGLAVETARTILTTLVEQPQVSEEAKKFIWEKGSPDLKSYKAGHEDGFAQGNTTGFAKGVASILGVLVVAAGGIGAYLLKKK